MGNIQFKLSMVLVVTFALASCEGSGGSKAKEDDRSRVVCNAGPSADTGSGFGGCSPPQEEVEKTVSTQFSPADTADDGDQETPLLPAAKTAYFENSRYTESTCSSTDGCAAWAAGWDIEEPGNYLGLAGHSVTSDFMSAPQISGQTNFKTTVSYGILRGDERGLSRYGTTTPVETQMNMTYDPSSGRFSGENEKISFDTKVTGYEYSGSFTEKTEGVNGVVEGHVNERDHIGAFQGAKGPTGVVGYLSGH